MRVVLLVCAVWACGSGVAATARAGDFELAGLSVPGLEVAGEVAAELRLFPRAPQFPGQLHPFQPSIAIEPELLWESGAGDHQAAFIPFARLDGQDRERSHADIREAYWRTIGDDWELLVGLNRVFFGVTESRHLVNIVNQIDQVENIDEEDFLGEPMINLVLQRDVGRFSFFVMPGVRERTFPGSDGRLRTPLPVDDDDPDYESGLGQAATDALARYSHFFGDWDVGAYYFYGTGREPRLLPNATGSALVPFYEQIHQVGLDIQYTTDAWLWKFEGIGRQGQGRPFGAVVAGFEYTRYQILESNADLGLLAEGLYDGRDSNEAPPTAFDNDLFLGARLTLNDVQDTALLAGTVVDLLDATTSFRVEAERRLGEAWKLELEGQVFLNAARDNPIAALERDDFLLLRLTRFF